MTSMFVFIGQMVQIVFCSVSRYLYLTILREPISRYLSEWRHVRRGATWIGSKLRCNGRQATLEEVPFCFEGNVVTRIVFGI